MSDGYRGVLLPKGPSFRNLRDIVADYETMVVTVMQAIADRHGRWPDYPFVNTKLNLITGEEFDEDDPIKGKGAIYGWIQGRALESLVGHCRWLRRRGMGEALVIRLEEMMRGLFDKLRDVRSRHAGRLRFFMTPEGDPFVLDDDGMPAPAVVDLQRRF